VANREEPLPERIEPSTEQHQTLHAEVKRLETELERYRTHAERTSKLFLSATSYAQWVRESARHDAELALRKVRVKVEQFEAAAGELERTELQLARAREELARLQALTDETRVRLSAFLAAGLDALNTVGVAGQTDVYEPALGDLQDTLHGQLASPAVSEPGQPAEAEKPER
jgi:DNA repair exonuclease SbcCD ATPase subunit